MHLDVAARTVAVADEIKISSYYSRKVALMLFFDPSTLSEKITGGTNIFATQLLRMVFKENAVPGEHYFYCLRANPAN